ncbi:tape measure protein [Limosilactobacillus fermentum]|uniref:tape measure protein n=1 Tax=Limosilactobacillus fermentum TaxID=1613 RepID=UPI0022E1603A|nr:tape measure protein [Limosilactobacillus fermentum]
MAADGRVIIEFDLDTDGVQSDADKVKDILNGISKSDNDIKIGVDDGSAKEKIKQIADDASRLPKETRTELKAISDKAGIEDFDKFLKLLPKEERVKLLTDFQDKGIVDFQHALSQIPKEKRSEVKLNDNASEPIRRIKKGIDEVPTDHKTTFEADTSTAEQHIGLLGRAQQQAEGKTTSFTSALKGTAIGMGIYNLAAKAAAAVSDQFAGAVSRFDTLNNFPKVMESMGASSTQANQAIKTLSNGIQGLPTSLDEVATTTQVFMPLSKNANDAAKATLALNDAFLASNATTADASRGLEQYKQMLANGKVDMMGWRSVEETMPASLQKVAKSFGIASGSTQELYNQLDSGKITMKELNDRFIQLDGGANGFHQTALQATNGIGTAFKNMGTRTKIALANVLTGFNDMVKTLTGSSIGGNINKLTSQFGNFGKAGQQAFEGLGKWLKPLTPAFKAFGDIIGTIYSGLKDALSVGSSFDSITAPLKNSAIYAKPLNDALKGIASHKTALKAIGAAVGSIAAGFLAYKSVVGTINLVTKAIAGLRAVMALLSTVLDANPIGLAVGVVVALGVAFMTAYNHSKTFRDGVNAALAAVKGFFIGVGKFFTGQLGWEKAIGNEISKIVSTIGKAFGKLGDILKKIGKVAIMALVYALALPIGIGITIMRPLINGITSAFSKLWAQVKKVWQTAWNGLVKVASAIWKPISKPIQAGLRLIQSLINAGLKLISRIWQNEVNFWVKIISIVWNTIKKVVTAGMRSLETVINPILKAISSVWNTTWNAISDFFGNVWNGMSKTGKSVFGGIRDWMGGILDAIGKKWSDVWNGLASTFSSIWDGIKSVAKSGWNAIIGFINTGVDGINSVIHFFGGKSDTVPKLKKLAHGTSANDRDELALVNDEGGDTYQEAIVRANGKVEIPKDRNQLVYLNRGDEVIPAQKTAEMFGLNRYANGKKGWLSAAWDNVKDWAGDTFEAIEDALKNPLGVLTGLFHKGKNTATAVWHDVGEGAANYLPKVGVNWFKKELQKLEDALTPSNPGGSGVERWKPYIEKAFKELGVAPADWKVAKLLRQINTESSGNPLAWQGVHDVNSGGNEARGLLQFAGSTWRADALPGHTDWRNGYDEILAAIHVLERGGEGGWGNVGNGHGWANGGWADRPSIFGEVKGQKEIAINPFRPTSEHHILEAIRERAAKSPSGFAAQLNQIITRQQMASHQIQPATPSSNEVPTLGSGGRVSGNLTMNFVVDGTTMARVTYPKYKALMAHEITIRGAGGAVPVGQAIPVGGGF